MREIVAFLGEDDPAALMVEGAARLHEAVARAPAVMERLVARTTPLAS